MGAISGKVMFGGHHASKNFLRRYTGYVEQFGGRPRLTSCELPVARLFAREKADLSAVTACCYGASIRCRAAQTR